MKKSTSRFIALVIGIIFTFSAISQIASADNIGETTVITWKGTVNLELLDVPDGLTDVKAIAKSKYYVALKEDGTVVAWNDQGLLDVPAGLTNVKDVFASGDRVFALKEDGTVVAWNDQGLLDVPAGLTNVKDMAFDSEAFWKDTFALKEDGTVVAWNDQGLLDVPDGLTNVKTIAPSSLYHCTVALKKDGTVVAWGDTRFTDVPTGLTNVKEISSGPSHVVALKEDGTLVAWGWWPYTYTGQPTIPDGLTNVKAIDASNHYIIALKDDGTVVAWGDQELLDVPAGLTNVKAVFSIMGGVAALKDDGTFLAWNNRGLMNLPSGLTNVKAIVSNGLTTMVLKQESESFSDISDHWASKYIYDLFSKGIINGYEDNTFRPENLISREEAAQMLSNYMGGNDKSVSVPFDSKGRWSTPAIQNLMSQKIISGYEDESFRPQNNITRAEFSTMVYNMMSSKGLLAPNTRSFSDTSDHWGKGAIEGLAGNGVINGYENGSFKPDSNITRAEAATIISKADSK